MCNVHDLNSACLSSLIRRGARLECVRHGFKSHLSAVSGLVLCCFVFPEYSSTMYMSICSYRFPLVGVVPPSVVEKVPELADLPLVSTAVFSQSPSHSAACVPSPFHSSSQLDTPLHTGEPCHFVLGAIFLSLGAVLEFVCEFRTLGLTVKDL